MKNVIKRVITLGLVLLLVVNIAPINVNASSNNKIETIAADFMNMVINSPNDYGLNNMSDKFQLSTAITPYKYNESGLLEEMVDTKYYFIYSNKKPIATLISNEDASSIFFETDTAKELQAYASKSFTVVCDDQGAHIYSTTYDVNPLKKSTSINLTKDTLYENTTNIFTPASSFAPGYGLSIPIIQQYNDNNCWAACVASAGKYFRGTTKTARQVCDAMGIGYNTGADLYQIVSALKQVYSLNNSYLMGGITDLTGIYFLLSGNIVPLAIFYSNIWDGNSSNDSAHSVIIQGYSASTQGSFLRIMDPNFSSYCIIFSGVDPTGLSTWTFSYGTKNYYWQNTILAY